MPIQVDWDPNLPAIITYLLEGQWTWAEFFKASEQEFELVTAIPGQRYDVIANFTRTNHVPVGAAVSHVNRINQQRQQFGGLVVVLTSNQFIASLVKIGQKVYPIGNDNFRTAKTLEEALTLITNHRSLTS